MGAGHDEDDDYCEDQGDRECQEEENCEDIKLLKMF